MSFKRCTGKAVLIALIAVLLVTTSVTFSIASLSAATNNPERQPNPAPVTLYDPDPNHLWNRLHQALHFRLSDYGQPGERQVLLPGDQSQFAFGLDAMLWPTGAMYLRLGEQHKAAIAVLDEFLAKDGEKLISDSSKRAFLQRDLWAIFDWTRSASTDLPGRNLRIRLAKAIHRLALSPAEIKALPDNFAAVAASKKLADFPVDLWVPQGPWVLLGDDNKNSRDALSITPLHDFVFGGRSAFLVFENDSADRAALLRRMLLIDNECRIRLSPITETVQIRGQGLRQEFKLDRKDFLDGKIPQSLHRITSEDKERPEILLLGYNAGYYPEPILRSCSTCHDKPDLNSRTQIFSVKVGPARARPHLVASTLEVEATKCIRSKSNQPTWGLLQGLWEGHTP